MEANRRAEPAGLQLAQARGRRDATAGFDEKSKRSALKIDRVRFASLSDATAESRHGRATQNSVFAVRQRLVAASHQATGMQRSLDQSMNKDAPGASEARRSAWPYETLS